MERAIIVASGSIHQQRLLYYDRSRGELWGNPKKQRPAIKANNKKPEACSTTT